MNDISPTVIEQSDNALTVPQPVFVPLASPSCGQVCGALAAAQGAFKTPKRTKEATIKGSGYAYTYKYAPLEEIVDAVKDALAQNGLARHQYLVSRGGQPVMRTIIWHASGEWIASDYPIHPTKEGPQGFASGVTYARRYGLSLALGLAPEDDDDANLAEGNVVAPRLQPAGPMSDGPPFEERRPRQPVGMARPKVNPLPPQAEIPHDRETGEIVEPHAIPVPLAGDKPNWVGWGQQVIARLKTAKDYDEAKAWVVQCTPSIREAKEAAPVIHGRVMKAIEETRTRFPDPAADFIEASEIAVPF